MEIKNIAVPENGKIKGQNSDYLHWIIRMGMGANLALGFVYLLLLNSLSTSGFDLEELKFEKLTFQKELEVTDIALAIPTSLYALERDETIQIMPDATNKMFLSIEDEGGFAFLDTKR